MAARLVALALLAAALAGCGPGGDPKEEAAKKAVASPKRAKLPEDMRDGG